MSKIMDFVTITKFAIKGKSPFYEMYCKDKKVLDLACGDGSFLKNDKKNIIGLDNNDAMIERAAKSNMKILKGDLRDKLPFEDAAFDVVHNANVIEHLTPYEAYFMLKEIARVLKTNGVLILSTELATQKIWWTFSHERPYPPECLRKIFSDDANETFPPLKMLKLKKVFYNGRYCKFLPLAFFFKSVAFFLPIFRRSYVAIIRKQLV